jgi:hypothetical protein
MRQKLASLQSSLAPFHGFDKAVLFLEKTGDNILHSLIEVAALLGRTLRKPSLQVGLEMDFHALKIPGKRRAGNGIERVAQLFGTLLGPAHRSFKSAPGYLNPARSVGRIFALFDGAGVCIPGCHELRRGCSLLTQARELTFHVFLLHSPRRAALNAAVLKAHAETRRAVRVPQTRNRVHQRSEGDERSLTVHGRGTAGDPRRQLRDLPAASEAKQGPGGREPAPANR